MPPIGEHERGIDFPCRITVVRLPSSTVPMAERFANVSAKREQLFPQSLGKDTSWIGYTVDGIVVNKSVDVIEAFNGEVGTISGRFEGFRHPCGHAGDVISNA